MRMLATAAAAAALTLLPAQAASSTPSAAPEQTKPHTEAGQLNGGELASMPSAEAAAAKKKKPTQQTATQSGVSAEPKPGHTTQASADGGMASPVEG